MPNVVTPVPPKWGGDSWLVGMLSLPTPAVRDLEGRVWRKGTGAAGRSDILTRPGPSPPKVGIHRDVGARYPERDAPAVGCFAMEVGQCRRAGPHALAPAGSRIYVVVRPPPEASSSANAEKNVCTSVSANAFAVV